MKLHPIVTVFMWIMCVLYALSLIAVITKTDEEIAAVPFTPKLRRISCLLDVLFVSFVLLRWWPN